MVVLTGASFLGPLLQAPSDAMAITTNIFFFFFVLIDQI
jgi:hypothetical protein